MKGNCYIWLWNGDDSAVQRAAAVIVNTDVNMPEHRQNTSSSQPLRRLTHTWRTKRDKEVMRESKSCLTTLHFPILAARLLSVHFKYLANYSSFKIFRKFTLSLTLRAHLKAVAHWMRSAAQHNVASCYVFKIWTLFSMSVRTWGAPFGVCPWHPDMPCCISCTNCSRRQCFSSSVWPPLGPPL